MDRRTHKHYHKHEINSQDIYDTYFSSSVDENLLDEVFIFPLKAIVNDSKLGHIKGDTLIDISAGANIFHILPICTYFKDITILEFNDACLKDLQKWQNKEPGAFDWSHASKIVAELEGCSDKWEEREDDLRRRIKNILKCDFNKENPTDPVALPKADCVFSLFVLAHISEDLNAYRHNLKILSSMLKLGGRLLLVGKYNGTFYSVGGHKYHVLKFSEEEHGKILRDCGFCLDYTEVKESKVRKDIMHCSHFFFVSAVKIKEM
ncbi:indolethylamine N-methyltransferase-like [Pelobates fuscus]|uniref:indolethylamine N-methyltransferase-like n=1 Tax=Pelobates fuscus TaxID=191477 RepID=UPI002FE4B143